MPGRLGWSSSGPWRGRNKLEAADVVDGANKQESKILGDSSFSFLLFSSHKVFSHITSIISLLLQILFIPQGEERARHDTTAASTKNRASNRFANRTSLPHILFVSPRDVTVLLTLLKRNLRSQYRPKHHPKPTGSALPTYIPAILFSFVVFKLGRLAFRLVRWIWELFAFICSGGGHGASSIMDIKNIVEAVAARLDEADWNGFENQEQERVGKTS